MHGSPPHVRELLRGRTCEKRVRALFRIAGKTYQCSVLRILMAWPSLSLNNSSFAQTSWTLARLGAANGRGISMGSRTALDLPFFLRLPRTSVVLRPRILQSTFRSPANLFPLCFIFWMNLLFRHKFLSAPFNLITLINLIFLFENSHSLRFPGCFFYSASILRESCE